MENHLDGLHTGWLHGYYYRYILEQRGEDVGRVDRRLIKKIGYERYEHGIIGRRVFESEDDAAWRMGYPIIFPYAQVHGDGIARCSISFEVPIDDTTTLNIGLESKRPGVPVPPQTSIPYTFVSRSRLVDEEGNFRLENTDGQDEMAFCTQGVVTNRSLEHLGQSDIGVILYRQMLVENYERIQEGLDPINVYRDPATAPVIQLFDGRSVDAIRELENQLRQRPTGTTPQSELLLRLFRQAEEDKAAGRELLPEPPMVLPQTTGQDLREATIYKGEIPARHYWRDPEQPVTNLRPATR